MEFIFGEKENKLRSEMKAFLDKELPPDWAGIFVDDRKAWDQAKDFCRKFGEKGWLAMAWPKEYGGRNATHWEQAVVREELWSHDEPRGPQYMNLNWIGPSIMLFGTEEQKKQFLPPIARGEVTWCQGFSEPNAGSDLANLQTRAVEDGDYYVINGQKIWTSYSDLAEWFFLLARTDPDLPRHKGISVFLLPMTTPGIKVRPLGTMIGPHHLNEVFLDNLRVPKSAMLGEKNRGWYVVMAALSFERTGVARYARSQKILQDLMAYARSTKRNGKALWSNEAVRQRFAELWTRGRVAQLMSYRVTSLVEKGLVPEGEASVARVHNIQFTRDTALFGMELLGLDGTLKLYAKGAPLEGKMEYYYGESLAGGVAAGSLEIQRNTIANRALGLPKGS